ncbi:MAG TPA: DUF169 domain-containing protein [Thermodesulfovibrionales bacterium]|nr:DUF169 domain-containing protein [Thermodesulfovibrionales bacterium]
MTEKETLREFMDVLGLDEEPMGMYYTNQQPEGGFCPKKGTLPSASQEAKGEVDFGTLFEHFSCVIGNIWLARRRKTWAYFDREHFGCLGGAFYLGFLKPQLDFIAHYVSSGIPGHLEGEHYLESPEVTRAFFKSVDPPPAPARFCVFKPMSQFAGNEMPAVVTFFARAEVIAGLNQLATFVTNDFEAVSSPFGAGCTNIVTWPLKYLSEGKLKAVIGGWDPSDRKFLKTDEITFAVPYEMYKRMRGRWPESFLSTKTWAIVKKKIALSKKTWGELPNARSEKES